MSRGTGTGCGQAASRGEQTDHARPAVEDCWAAVARLDAFALRFHDCEHGRSGYAFSACPFGCDKLVAASATITSTLDMVHAREQDWDVELAQAKLDLPITDLSDQSSGAVPRVAEEAASAYREAVRTLFLHGHGRSEETLAALDLIEGELLRATGICERAAAVFGAQRFG